jgi:hypothetical protein
MMEGFQWSGQQPNRTAMTLSRCAALLCSMSLMSAAHAMDIETYDKQVKLPPTSAAQVRLTSYLLGLGEGLRLANSALRARGEPEFFCAPENANLFAADYRRLIDGALAGARATLYNQQQSIEQILLKALQDAYPCAGR